MLPDGLYAQLCALEIFQKISQNHLTEGLTAAQERSLFSSAINPAECDRIITLSTCSYEFYNARFVVLGKIS